MAWFNDWCYVRWTAGRLRPCNADIVLNLYSVDITQLQRISYIFALCLPGISIRSGGSVLHLLLRSKPDRVVVMSRPSHDRPKLPGLT